MEAAFVLAAATVIGDKGSKTSATALVVPRNSANTGGFDFAKTSNNRKVESINGGLKLSAKKSADSLIKSEVTGFKLTITSLCY